MTGMTTNFEVEEYLDAVRAALADLPPETRDDLLEDLPDHLTEVLAEGGALRERLGDPVEYAAELRAAAGLDTSETVGRVMSFRDLARRFGAHLERADLTTGRMFGYRRVSDLGRALQPGWWFLRGWLLAQLVCYAQGTHEWTGVVPRYDNSRLVGAVILAVAVVASVAIGRRSLRVGAWPRSLVIVVNLAIAVWALAVLPGDIASGNSSGPVSFEPNPTDSITDIYVYDSTGKRVDNARLYDQNGNPIQLGNPYCSDGSVASAIPTDGYYLPGEADPNQAPWTYPLCPGASGPFGSGPGALPKSSGTPTTPVTPSPAPTPTR